MGKLQIQAFAILASLAAICSQTTATNSPSVCVDAAALQSFNFTRISPQLISNGTCRDVYSVGGACVSVTSALEELRKKYDWLRTKAMDAKMFNMQRGNASVYFQVRNGQMTKLEAQARLNSSGSSLKSVMSAVTNLVASVTSKLADMFGGMPDWIRNNFNMGNDQINPCFQALQNITDSSYCVFTSANSFGRNANPLFSNDPRVPSFLLTANVRSAGRLMRQCNALIDTYCTLTYGVSVMSASKPFNMTFNWGDNSGISERTCMSMAGYVNSTNSGEVAAMDSIYVDMFHTNWVRFVPSQQAITNMGAFLTNKEFDKDPSAFTPVQSSPNGFGLGISSQSAVGAEADLEAIARNSGAPRHVYSASRFAIGVVMSLFALGCA